MCVCVLYFLETLLLTQRTMKCRYDSKNNSPASFGFLGLPFLFSILLCRAHQIVEKYDWETFVEPISSDVTCAPNKNNATVKSRKWNTHTHTSATIKTVCSRRDIECRNSNINNYNNLGCCDECRKKETRTLTTWRRIVHNWRFDKYINW